MQDDRITYRQFSHKFPTCCRSGGDLVSFDVPSLAARILRLNLGVMFIIIIIICLSSGGVVVKYRLLWLMRCREGLRGGRGKYLAFACGRG